MTSYETGHDHDTCARLSDGTAWCWGGNDRGQLGDGSTDDRSRAVQVTIDGDGPLTNVTSISAGGLSSCASTADGSAWCWGDNAMGQLGDGTDTERHGAVQVTRAGGSALTDVSQVSAGGLSSCARTTDGYAWCWGANGEGGLGDGTTTDRLRAVPVTRKGGQALTGVASVTAHSTLTQDPFVNHACARTSDGSAWCWGGYNYWGVLGDGSRKRRVRAVKVEKSNGDPLTGVRDLSTNIGHTCARRRDGTAWCWGSNLYYEVGDGTTKERLSAVKVKAA